MKLVTQTSDEASALLLADEALMRADGDRQRALKMLRRAIQAIEDRGKE